MWNLCEPSFEALVTAQVASNPLIKVDEIKVVVGSRLLVVCGMSDCNLCCKVLSTLEHSSRALTQAWSPASDKMLDLLRGLKSLVKLSHVQIDSSIFRLHYVRTPANVYVPNNNTAPLLQTITVMACLAFSLLVTARQYVGNPIDCVHTKDIPEVAQRMSHI